MNHDRSVVAPAVVMHVVASVTLRIRRAKDGNVVDVSQLGLDQLPERGRILRGELRGMNAQLRVAQAIAAVPPLGPRTVWKGQIDSYSKASPLVSPISTATS